MPEPRKYFIPPSIRSETLFIYLDRTKGEHNGFNGKQYDKMVHAHVNSTGRARAYNVTNHTNTKWEDIYYDEGFGPKWWREDRARKLAARIAYKNELKNA